MLSPPQACSSARGRRPPPPPSLLTEKSLKGSDRSIKAGISAQSLNQDRCSFQNIPQTRWPAPLQTSIVFFRKMIILWSCRCRTDSFIVNTHLRKNVVVQVFLFFLWDCCDSGGCDADVAASHISACQWLITECPDQLTSVSQHPNTWRCLLTRLHTCITVGHTAVAAHSHSTLTMSTH